ncbi:DNA gyrase inhibitor YacG [bacterium]|nr:DNA gyrase inhibitor YacG [bacterium]
MRTAACPICKKTIRFERLSDQPFFPFCSERCKLVDLGRWIDGSYTISRELNEEELEMVEELIEEQVRRMEESEYDRSED